MWKAEDDSHNQVTVTAACVKEKWICFWWLWDQTFLGTLDKTRCKNTFKAKYEFKEETLVLVKMLYQYHTAYTATISFLYK
jgi:hypothetical protein